MLQILDVLIVVITMAIFTDNAFPPMALLGMRPDWG